MAVEGATFDVPRRLSPFEPFSSGMIACPQRLVCHLAGFGDSGCRA